MPPRTKAPKARGEAIRAAILRELRRRELALEPTPTIREVGDAIGVGHSLLGYHVRVLKNTGLLSPARRLHLTADGRARANELK